MNNLLLLLAYIPPLLSIFGRKLGYVGVIAISVILAYYSLTNFTSVASYFGLLSSLVWVLISTFSLFNRKDTLLEVAITLSIAGMITVLDADEYLIFLVGWEVMSIPIYYYLGKRGNFGSAFVFISFSEVSTVLLLSAFLVANESSFMVLLSPIPLMLATVGFLIKMGVIPFTAAEWLPIAQGNAPSTLSALVSSTITLMGVYGILKLSILTQTIPLYFPLILLVLGSMTVFFGALYAYVSESIKGSLAFSTAENNGAIVAALSVYMFAKSLNMTQIEHISFFSVLFYVFAHSIAKTGLFLATSLQDSTAFSFTKKFRGGLYTLGLSLATSSMSGLLPNLGGVASWLLLELLFILAYLLHNMLSVLFIVSGFTVAMGEGFATALMLKLISYINLFRNNGKCEKRVSSIIFVPGLMVLLLGIIMPHLIYPYETSLTSLGMFCLIVTQYQGRVFGGISPLYVFMLIVVLSGITYVVFGKPKVRRVNVWNNGVRDQEDYTAFALSNNVRLMLRKILKHESVCVNTDSTDIFWTLILRLGRNLRKIGKVFGRSFVNSSIQWYILYMVLTLIALIILLSL